MNGILTGFFKTYYPNGGLENVFTMREGARNGEYRHYDSLGNLLLVGHFMDGKLHGDNTGYYPSGMVKHRFKYKEGYKTGTGYMYHPNGVLKQKEYFALNGKDWIVEEYTDTGLRLSEKNTAI